MKKNPDMEHDDPNAKRLLPHGHGEIVWKFTKRGTFEFACLIPGHYEKGMVGRITVKEGARAKKAGEETMRKIAIAAVSILILSFTFATVTVAQAPMVNGQVTKIDEAAGKITLKHGPIKKLDMNEGMTMVFRVQDPAMLKQVKVGDKVKFDADRING